MQISFTLDWNFFFFNTIVTCFFSMWKKKNKHDFLIVFRNLQFSIKRGTHGRFVIATS
jgi:hypothetical protein